MELLRITITWLGFFVLAFANGTLREFVIKKFLDEPWAHHLSVFTCIAMFTVYLIIVWDYTKIESYKAAIIVGLYWFILTVFAETFLIGRLMSQQSWQSIFAAYDISKSLWPLVLVWVGLLPLFMLWFKK